MDYKLSKCGYLLKMFKKVFLKLRALFENLFLGFRKINFSSLYFKSLLL